MYKKLNFLLGGIVFIFCSCNQANQLWPIYGQSKTAKTYELSITDSSSIITNNGELLKIIQPHDSLFVEADTIMYNKPTTENKSVFSKYQPTTVLVHKSNPSVKEFYCFNNGGVQLVGYQTADTLHPYVAFAEPLSVLPALDQISANTNTYKQRWDNTKQKFEDDTKMASKVHLIQSGKMEIDGEIEEVLIYEVMLSGDAKMPYGEQELIIPDAFMVKSNLLYGKTQGLLYEWSIQVNRNENAGSEPNEIPEIKQYIEFIKYQ